MPPILSLAWAVKLRLIGLVAAGSLVWLYFRYDPAQHLFPKCPFLMLTGFKCPGCGSQRAVHQLLHGDITGAAQANILFVLLLPYVLLGLVLEYTAWGRQQFATRRRWYGYRATLLALVIVIGYWVARNVWNF